MKSRTYSALLLAAALIIPGMARATDDLEEGLATMWEVLWHQSGTPTRVVRWEGDIHMRLSGIDVAKHRDMVLQAMSAVTTEANIRLVDVSDRPDLPANLTIEITPDTALEDNQPCVTVLNFRNETRIETASVQMRSKDAWRCAHHEAMHVMGVRGHPAGKTVLSYFPFKVDALLPLDQVMLRAWYSPRMAGGMTPFEAMTVLADELVATQPDAATATQVRNRFFSETVQQMHNFANGNGDIPAVVRRSGKSTDDGIRWGRAEMSYFLGMAYLNGAAVAADRTQAIQWFERAASAGNRRAQAQLGSFR
ncbi:hypothetical protein WG922_12160 [Ramlibacter sp. AN1015]|uniref:hypothetical protein n=1 Tax=Ramlibacter sp. AN1015 TaxID=3133428 RepID=UPI0030BE1EF1